MSNAVAVTIPSNIELPTRLRGADIAAQIAAENAAAAGGIKVGGFPRISIKANRFSIVDGDEVQPLNQPQQPGQPVLPLMCLEIAVISANPALSKTYYEGEFVEGQKAAPDCQSSNGVTPDPSIASPQNSNCANCPMNAWGSAQSKLTGKDTKACKDSKQLAILPAGDLLFKMLGLTISAGSLRNWGDYVKALTGRGYPVSELVTNVTFDATANGVLQFGFNRFLTDDEVAKAKARSSGDDVKAIIQPSVFVPAAPALPTPTQPAAPAIAAPMTTAPVTVTATPVAAAPVTSPSIAAATTSFAATPAEPPKRTRAKRTPPAGTTVDLSHLPEAIRIAVNAVGVDSPAGQALIAQFAPPVAPPAPAVDPFAGQPPHVKMAVDAVGGYDSPAGKDMFGKLTGQTVAPIAPAPVAAAPVAPPPLVVNPTPVAAPAASAPTVGFGSTVPAATPPQTPTAQVTASGASLAEILKKKLGIAAGPATVQ